MRGWILCLTFVCLGKAHAQVDWRTAAGYVDLQSELGLLLPDGTAIEVLQSEANAGTPPALNYLPQGTASAAAFEGSGSFLGHWFTPHSGPGGASGHAAAVGGYFYTAGASVSPGVVQVHCFEAEDFIAKLSSGVNGDPLVFPGSVQNHSWVGSFGVEPQDVDALRRLDFMIARDGAVCVTPLNNGSTMYGLLSNAWHSITVGLKSGNHPQGGTIVDSTGRMKPDLVVGVDLTSFAGPATSSAAALLLDGIRPAYPAADDPRIIKAILIAAATKANLPAWHRVATNKPYDNVWGAGELNILNAWHILSGGEQVHSNASDIALKGWHRGTSSTAEPRQYFFTVPEGRWGATFSAGLTWHRSIGPPFDTMTVSNLDLKVYKATGFVASGVPVDQSTSLVDNVEHIFLRNLPSGQYVIEIPTTDTVVDYGLAWEVQLGQGPTLSLTRNPSNQAVLSLAGLDPYVTYNIEASSELTAGTWGTLGSIRTADTVASTTTTWTDTTTPLSGPRFYRLRWTGGP